MAKILGSITDKGMINLIQRRYEDEFGFLVDEIRIYRPKNYPEKKYKDRMKSLISDYMHSIK